MAYKEQQYPSAYPYFTNLKNGYYGELDACEKRCQCKPKCECKPECHCGEKKDDGWKKTESWDWKECDGCEQKSDCGCGCRKKVKKHHGKRLNPKLLANCGGKTITIPHFGGSIGIEPSNGNSNAVHQH